MFFKLEKNIISCNSKQHIFIKASALAEQKFVHSWEINIILIDVNFESAKGGGS